MSDAVDEVAGFPVLDWDAMFEVEHKMTLVPHLFSGCSDAKASRIRISSSSDLSLTI